ncbi:MAG: transglycosylase SLT domain-containing protein [Bacteroidia bacterium]
MKILTGLNIILIAAIIALLTIQASDTDERKHLEEFNQFYRVYSLEMPQNLNFAGSIIKTNDFDIAERYDREILTNVYWQSQTLLLLKRANRYFPTIERILRDNNIPDDFKYVALAESGLQHVVSPAGAAGFWQFLDKTGKRYGLEITEQVDERYNIEKSTIAACKYFKEAYSIFKDWSLVAASYNMGIEGVRRQVAAQGINNYFDLYLNTETARYLFRILSLKAIHQNPSKYGFNIAQTHLYKNIETITVPVSNSISNLQLWSVQQQCNYKLLKLLNPWLRKSFLNVEPGKIYYIQLPKYRLTNTDLWVKVKNDTLYLDESGTASLIKEDVMPVVEHKVMKGETLESIAAEHGVLVTDLIKWNNLNGKQISVGQILKIRQGVEE